MVKSRLIALVSFTLFAWSSASAESNVVRDSLDLDKSFSDSPADLIRGKVSGVKVSSYDGTLNGADNVVIRGISSIHKGIDNQPLWIVDGVEVNNAIQQNLDAFWQYGESNFTAPVNQLAFLNAYDIESIEVLKNIAATSVYGSKGASGVIIVKTKKRGTADPVVSWTSNIGVGVPEYASEYLKPSVSHNHTVSVNGTKGKNLFGVSGFYRDMKGAVSGTGSRYGGVRFNLDALSAKVVSFGVNASISMGKMSNTSGSAYLGQPSFSLSLRDPATFPGSTAAGWMADYDDDVDDLRALAGAYLNFDFGHGFKWSNALGMDLQDDKRYIWYGEQTPFGREMKNAAAIIGAFVFKEKFTSTLDYQRYFGKHVLKASLGFEQNALTTSFNTMNGVEFFNANLRAKGLDMHRDMAKLRKIGGDLNQLSAIFAIDYSMASLFGVKASVRPDFLPRFLEVPVFYYSASAFFDIKRTFFKESIAVSDLILRGGYGTAGKASQIPYSGVPVVEVGAEPYYSGLGRLYTSEANVSLETSFIGGRIGLAAGFYDRKTDDTYSMFCFGKKTGLLWTSADRSEVFERKSRIGNKGVELDITAEPVRSSGVTWTISANVAFNKNELLEVCGDDRFIGTVGSNTVVNVNEQGLPVGTILGLQNSNGGGMVLTEAFPQP